MGRHELDAAMPMPVVVPVEKAATHSHALSLLANDLLSFETVPAEAVHDCGGGTVQRGAAPDRSCSLSQLTTPDQPAPERSVPVAARRTPACCR
jgi:hypothetical protein